jgi:hypothetical protein
MAEGRVAEVVGQRQRLRQVLVEAELARDRARDLRTSIEWVRRVRKWSPSW